MTGLPGAIRRYYPLRSNEEVVYAASHPSRRGGPGGAGTGAMTGHVTWDHARVHLADTGQQHVWTNPGGDFLPGSSGSMLVNDPNSYELNGAGLVADVQFWVDNPRLNCGWTPITEESVPETARQFYSNTNDDRPPRLILGY